MLVGLIGSSVGTAAVSAASESPLGTPNINESSLFYSIGDSQEVYFPWVYNTDDFGLGDSQGSVTVQNLSQEGGYVYFFVGNGDGYDYTTYAPLNGGASKTFSADQIGVPAPGAPVIAALYYNSLITVGDSFTLCEPDVLIDLNGDGAITDYCETYDTTADVWAPLPLAGLVKSAVAGATLPYTTPADSAVSGYNGLSGAEVGEYTDEGGNTYGDVHYLPIVQTNCGPGGCWDTRITVANFLYDSNQAVTVRFFPADDGSGALQTGFQLQALVGPGGVFQIDLGDFVPTGWVGSAHVFSDGDVGVIADRYKVGTNMWLTNIGSNATSEFDYQHYNFNLPEPYVLFAPSVYMGLSGWNTGINVANLYEGDNNVNIQYYVNSGNAIQTQTQRLAAFGMTYFYNPSNPPQDVSQQPPVYDTLAGALILSEEPVAAAVDAVKYYGNDSNVGQAMTYNATGNLHTFEAMPLVQKGNPADGMGATSGLNFINPTPLNNPVTVYWLNQSGFQADNYGYSTVIIPPASLGFVYTMSQHNLPNGYYGSAIAIATYPVAMVSANVDYQVAGDGSTIWNGYNPCGLFRQNDFDTEGSYCPFLGNGLGDGAQGSIHVVKTVKTDAGDPIEGARVELYTSDDNSDYFDYYTYTNANGEAFFSNVTPGNYYIDVTLPAGYTFTEGTLGDPSVEGEGYITDEGPYTFSQDGSDYSIDNTAYVASVEKIVDTNVPGITVCIFTADTTIPADINDEGGQDDAVECATADDNGNATFSDLVAGTDYIAVAQGMGYDQMTDAFNIADPGTSETNILTSAAPGALTKQLFTGDLGLGISTGEFSLNSDVIFCKASLMDLDPVTGEVLDTTQCDNWTEDDAAVAHGGFDDYIGGSDYIFEFNAEVAPGAYVICSSAEVTGDFDADPLTPDETIGYDFMCESTSDTQTVDETPTTGPIIVYSGEETIVENDLEALATGPLDVFVNDDDTDAPIDGATVCLYDQSHTLVSCADTDATGYATFADTHAGVYIVAVTSPDNTVYDDSGDITVSYSVSDDAANGGLDDTGSTDGATADAIVSLDNAAAPPVP
jgi:hypothetical protein